MITILFIVAKLATLFMANLRRVCKHIIGIFTHWTSVRHPKTLFLQTDLYMRQNYLGEKTDNGTIQCVHSPCGIYVIKLLLRNKQNIVMPSTAAAATAKSLQSCPTLHDPIDNSPPGSPIPGILQARILEWVAISFTKAWKWKVKVKSLSRVWLLATPWTAAYQAPWPMGFSRQEYGSGVPLPSPTELD